LLVRSNCDETLSITELFSCESLITKILQKLKASRKRRELFVAGQIKTGIPFQIRALRDKKGWTQGELGAQLGMTQTNISRLESPGYGRLNITTLQRIAAAFDVGLIIRFVPFSELIGWVDKLSPEAVAPKSFDEEIEMLESKSTANVNDLQIISSKVVQIPRIFYGGTVITFETIDSETNDWVASEPNDWAQLFSNVKQIYVTHPDEDHLIGLPDEWVPGHAHLVKGGTTAELVM
jgi:transcriptional regulator with XRE-family HTH domain